MYDQFKTRAEGVSAEVHRFPTQATALDFILGFLRDEGVADAPQRRAVWADCPFLAGIDRQQLEGIKGLHLQVSREQAAEAHIGISQMDWALADTGTLAQDASAIDKRLVSTLPFIHIALVPTTGLTPDMPTWLTQVQPKDSAYLSLITGPSRTADIERVLTIGVHGPERLIIIFVDELGGTH
ncbi:MAG: lactate utilization protein [Desulfobulbaceae bacterium]|jgi:L-lactate dehydrogenase complex protein LldG|nr:lactate utilization protein [Desulfobulbaceae bacterium]